MGAPTLPRRLVAEAIGTGLLLAAVVGSGIMGERLANGNVAIEAAAQAPVATRPEFPQVRDCTLG
jgi:glycerol uptake facilitator-like aquaporin